jgi:hypothetical protein
MPDFDTRESQEPNEPNKLRALVSATRPRIVLFANRVRSLLIANRLRALLIGGGSLLFVVVAVPIGLLIYSSSGLGGPATVTCNKEYLSQEGECIAPSGGSESVVCEAESRALVEKQGICRKGTDDLYVRESVTCDSWMLGKTGECFAPESSDEVEVCQAENRYEVDDETPCSPSY